MNLILMGPQGSGKGSIAKRITQDFGLVSISTGDLFRQAIARGDKLGLEAKAYMDKGELVPIELTLKILTTRLKGPDCRKGVILDGFPRSLQQAQALEKVLQVDKVILLELDRDECIKRITNRRVCEKCGEIYGADNYLEKTCQKCGGKIVQRDDDKLDAINTRLEVYEKMTTPLIDFYSDRLVKFSALGSREEVYAPVKTFLTSLKSKTSREVTK